MLSVLSREMEEIRASQSKMLVREEKLDKKRKPSATITSSEKKAKTDEVDDKKIKEDTKSNTKEGDVKDEKRIKSSPVLFLIKTRG